MKELFKKHGLSITLSFLIFVMIMWIVYCKSCSADMVTRDSQSNCDCGYEAIVYQNALNAMTDQINTKQVEDKRAREALRPLYNEGIYYNPVPVVYAPIDKKEGFSTGLVIASDQKFSGIKGTPSPFIGEIRS